MKNMVCQNPFIVIQANVIDCRTQSVPIEKAVINGVKNWVDDKNKENGC